MSQKHDLLLFLLLLKEMNTFIHQRHTELIKSDSKDTNNVAKDFTDSHCALHNYVRIYTLRNG